MTFLRYTLEDAPISERLECSECSAFMYLATIVLAPLAALGLLAISAVAIVTSGPQRIRLSKPIDKADRIDDWLYLPELLYVFMLIMVLSAGAGPYSVDAVILSLIDKHGG